MSSWSARITAAWARRGLLAWALLPLAAVFGALSTIRAALYRTGVVRPRHLAVPVVVVGNRVAGGAGKTPTTLALIDHLRQGGWHVGVVSRGYGRDTDDLRIVQPTSRAADVGDEPLLIRRRGGVPVVVGRDRSAAALHLLAAHPEVDLVLADDGLQHLRLARDVEVILFDERGAGNGWWLPAGPLRERIGANPLRATQLVLFSAGMRSVPLPGWAARRDIGGFLRLHAWAAGSDAAQLRPSALFDAGASRPCAAAGIAVPQRFFDQLTALGLRFDALPLPDHHDFETLRWPPGCRQVVVTEKDAVKLATRHPALLEDGAMPEVWVARLDFRPEPAFFAALDAALARVRPSAGRTSPIPRDTP